MRKAAAFLAVVAGFGSIVIAHGATTAPSSAPVPQDVSAMVKEDLGAAPGMVAAVIRSNSIIAQGAAGVRKRGGTPKVTINDRFHLGSDTKAMTALLCGILVDEGKLSWTTTIGDVFPELKAKMKPAWAQVTLEQLLTHHAGVEGDSTKQAWWTKAWAPGLDPVKGRQMMLEDIVARDPEAPPGTKFIYSNAGYSIAGHMAEHVAKKPWEVLIREKVWTPLHMTTAGLRAPTGDQPQGHHADGKPAGTGPGADNPETIGPAGCVHCSIGDWAKFIQMEMKGARGEKTLVRPETMAKLLTPVKANGPDEQDYAMGWIIVERPWAGGKTLTHAGSNTMWFCEAWVGPAADIAVLVMANDASPDTQAAMRKLETELVLKYTQK